LLSRLRPYVPLAVLASLIVYFGFQGLTGDRGLLEWESRNALLAIKTEELKRLRAERADLEEQARLLRDGSISRDLVEERARSLLGLSDPRDYVIRSKPARAG
jgi:cell division protein FtsB